MVGVLRRDRFDILYRDPVYTVTAEPVAIHDATNLPWELFKREEILTTTLDNVLYLVSCRKVLLPRLFPWPLTWQWNSGSLQSIVSPMIFFDGHAYLPNDRTQLSLRSVRCWWTARGFAFWKLVLKVEMQYEPKSAAMNCKPRKSSTIVVSAYRCVFRAFLFPLIL